MLGGKGGVGGGLSAGGAAVASEFVDAVVGAVDEADDALAAGVKGEQLLQLR